MMRILFYSNICSVIFTLAGIGGVFAYLVRKADIALDRRVLADLAVHDKPAFAAIVEQAKASLA